MLWVTKKKLQDRPRRDGVAHPALHRRRGRPSSSSTMARSRVSRSGSAPSASTRERRARYPAVNDRGQTAFEALVEEHCSSDPALVAMGRIVHDADRHSADEVPEAAGLRMISVSFPEVSRDDQEIIAGSKLLYDALYYSLAKREHRR